MEPTQRIRTKPRVIVPPAKKPTAGVTPTPPRRPRIAAGKIAPEDLLRKVLQRFPQKGKRTKVATIGEAATTPAAPAAPRTAVSAVSNAPRTTSAAQGDTSGVTPRKPALAVPEAATAPDPVTTVDAAIDAAIMAERDPRQAASPGPRMPRCLLPTTPRLARDVVIDGVLLRVPLGMARYRTRIGRVKYALRLDPATGEVRHWSRRNL